MFDASVLEVFVASTNDLKEERLASEEVLRIWNQSNSSSRQIMLKPLRWEEDATPELGPGGFQEVINSKLLSNADILIGIIGKRLGSPTKTAIAGTVEEINQFYRAKKPVLLFFSSRQYNLDDIDPVELQKVKEFQRQMQDLGLYLTFTSIDDFKVKLRNSLDALLKDYRAMLLPASRALAYGYYKNFVKSLYNSISDSNSIDLPDFCFPNPGGSPLRLCYSRFHLHIARQTSLDFVSDNAAKNFGKQLAELSIRTPRRAFRVYVPSETKNLISKVYQQTVHDAAVSENSQSKITVHCLDVLDYPTPLIALKDFVNEVEQSLLRGKQVQDALSGYWQRQKTLQHTSFYETLFEYINEDGLAQDISPFDFDNKVRDDLHLDSSTS